jgi:branched-chain amino acid transport system ATP-binding protein
MLKLQSVDVSYGHVQALRGLSLVVRDGELVALLGANGAGKSTALMSISGIVRPQAGTILYDGVDLLKASPFQIVRLGLIQCPEGRRIFGGLSVLENLRMGAIRRTDRSAVSGAIEQVFELFPVLGQRRHQSGATLSGGEQQMLAIARGLMLRPRLLMLDEPSLGLAPIMAENTFEKIDEIHREGISILLVEQNVVRALTLAQRGYVLGNGQIVLQGTAAELLENEQVKDAYLGL